MPPNQLPLKDLHLPEAISWFPPAIGWWLLVIFIPLIIWACYWFYKRLTRPTPLKTASLLLTQIKLSSMSNKEKLIAISSLLRRVAISLAPRAETASLTGQAWLDFLDTTLPDRPFTDGLGRCLIDAPYKANLPSESEISQLISLCEQWLKAQKTA